MTVQRKIHIDLAAMLALGWLVFVERSVWGVLSLAAAAVHEFGHLGAAWMMSLPIGGISIGVFGVRIKSERNLLSYREELLWAAAGPAMNLLTAAAVCGWCSHVPLPLAQGEKLLFFAAVSVLLALINLLPIRSFDGGRILRCLIAQLFGDRAAAWVLAISTMVSAVIFFLLSACLWLRYSWNLSLLLLCAALMIRITTTILPDHT